METQHTCLAAATGFLSLSLSRWLHTVVAPHSSTNNAAMTRRGSGEVFISGWLRPSVFLRALPTNSTRKSEENFSKITNFNSNLILARCLAAHNFNYLCVLPENVIISTGNSLLNGGGSEI